MPATYRETILRDLSVSRLLPRLVYDGVFSVREYRDILSRDGHPQRVESFLLKLCSKGPKAFCAFCSHLEAFCPYLLTCFFLYYQGKGVVCKVICFTMVPSEYLAPQPHCVRSAQH